MSVMNGKSLRMETGQEDFKNKLNVFSLDEAFAFNNLKCPAEAFNKKPSQNNLTTKK